MSFNYVEPSIFAGNKLFQTNAGSVTISGDLIVTGSATSAVDISTGNTTISGNLAVQGNIIQSLGTGSTTLSGTFISLNTATFSGAATFNSTTSHIGNSTFSGNTNTFTQPVIAGGSPNAFILNGGTHTLLSQGVEAIDINYNLARTVQWSGGTTLATQRAVVFQAPTYAFSSATTLSDAVTLDINSGPVAGTNATITNAYALRLGGGLQLLNDVNLVLGTANAAATATLMQYDTAETVDAVKIGLDETSRHLIVCDYGDIGTDTTRTGRTNPTIGVYAATFGTTKYIELSHDGTNGIINAGTGTIQLTIADANIASFNSSGALIFQGSGSGYTNIISPSTTGIQLRGNVTTSTTVANFSLINDAGTPFGASSGTQTFASLAFTTNQSGTAGYVGLILNVTETTVGSGPRNLMDLQVGGTTRFLVNDNGNVTLTQAVHTAGSPTALTVTGGAHTTLGASGEATDVNVNLARTVQFATGALSTQRAMLIQAPTYGFVGASTLTNAVTLEIGGAPLAGTNATITSQFAMRIATYSGQGSSDVTGLAIYQPGIANSIGAVSALFGLVVDASEGNDISLGNQTATLTDLSQLAVAPTTYISTTNVRTVTNPYGMVISGAPIASTNVTFTNGPWALAVSGETSLKNISSSITSAINVPAYTLTLANTTQVTSVGPAGIRIGQVTIAQSGGAVTVDNAASLYISAAPTVGASVTLTNAYSIWVDAGSSRFDGRLLKTQGADVASVTNLTLGTDGNSFELTGTTKVDLISNVGWTEGSTVTLIANESVVIDHGTATSGTNVQIRLAGAADYSMTAGDTLTLILSSTTAEGQAWREIARAAI